MIDPVAPAASWFLWLTAALFLVVYALPLLLCPFAWARVFLWKVNDQDELALYFGRCLGAVALAIVIVLARVAPTASVHGIIFDLVGLAGALLAAVHVYGALRRQQPWTETVEIVLYVGAAVAAWVLHP